MIMNDIRTFTEAQKRRAYERQGHNLLFFVFRFTKNYILDM